jgi:capsular polysaccharide biosynthesis protein
VLEHPDFGEFRTVQQPFVIQRNLPRTLSDEVDQSFQALLRVDAPERTLVCLRYGRVVGTSGLVVLPDGQFVGETIAVTPAGQRTLLANETGYATPLPPRPKLVKGRYYLLSVIGWRNYYHWNHDVVMRLYRVREHLPSDIRFIVPNGLRPYTLDPLKLLGLDESHLVPIAEREVWEVESLYIAIPIHKAQLTSSDLTRWFRETCLEAIGVARATPGKRIYVRRTAPDDHWRIVNHDQVESCLLQYGFESHYPGNMTFRQQAELFSQAQVLVGTGTGLFNMVFAPRGAIIVHLQEPSVIDVAFWTLSESLGHEYWYVLGTSVPNPGGPVPDIHVPVDLLRKTLQKLLS